MSTVKSSSENLTLNADGAGSDVVIQNNGTETVRVDSSGNVGIGITHTPTATLEVAGRIQTGTDSTHYGRFVGFSGSLYIGHRNDTADGTIIFGGFGGGTFTEFGRFNSNGNLLVNNQISFNSGYGSAAVAYGVRAWVNFNGTGTVAIRNSGNVSSITDLGTGNYRANFTNSMPDSQYVALPYSDGDFRTAQPTPSGFYPAYVEFTVRVEAGTYYDGAQCGIAVIR